MYFINFLTSILELFIKVSPIIKPVVYMIEEKIEEKTKKKVEEMEEKVETKLEDVIDEKIEEFEEKIEDKIESFDTHYKGTHIFGDYKGLIGDEYEIGQFIFQLMQDAIINASTMKIVHKNLVILNEKTQGLVTPPGFTSILALVQLDSSHMTACTSFTSHSYTEEKEMGLLCVDLFTCSCKSTDEIMQYFEEKLKEKYPNVERVSIEKHKRFKY